MSAAAVLGGYDTAVISALQSIKQRWVANLVVGVARPLRVHAIGTPATPSLCTLAPAFALGFAPEGPRLEPGSEGW